MARTTIANLSIFFVIVNGCTRASDEDSDAAQHCTCLHNTICVDSSKANDGCKVGHSKPTAAESTHHGPAVITGFHPDCKTCRCLTKDFFAVGHGLDQRPKIILLGLIKQFRMISVGVMRWLHQISCSDFVHVDVHIMTTKQKAVRLPKGKWKMSNEWTQKGADIHKPCNMHLYEDDLPMNETEGRVSRISKLRDRLRSKVHNIYKQKSTDDLSQIAVVVADLDLVDLANPFFVREAASRVTEQSNAGPDVVCSNGKDTNPQHLTYYDTFSTILSPNTFVYPVANRKHQQVFEGEMESQIIHAPLPGQPTEEILNLFTRDDLTNLFESDSITPVRSCFGGLAVYKYSTYFASDCSYGQDKDKYNVDERYSNSYTPGIGEESAACEHVILHECLRHNHGLTAVVARDLVPLWTRQKIFFE
eukprot:m.80325 g.80325  ORF g.80325 m.80325 type:complete len:419 (-) comp25304_c0_seq2:45-1301(-)